MTDQTNKDLPEFSLDRHDLFDLSIELLGVIEDVKNGMPFDDVCMETIISVRERLVCLDALSLSAPEAGSAPSDRRLLQIQRAHASAKPTADNPAWKNAHADLGYVLALLAQYGNPAWQPIETAPKDFVTEFDGWNGERVANVMWAHPECGEKGEYAWCRLAYEPSHGWVAHRVQGLTHWMPLPPAPQEDK